jgi:hypothetical protein
LIFQRYRINLQPGWQPRQKMSMSVPIKGGLPVTLTRRTDVDLAGKVAQ